MHSSSLCCTLWVAFLMLGGVSAAADGVPAKATQPPLEERVANFIAELGDNEYIVRQSAEESLQKIGLEAFDALYEAQEHDDIEVAMRARRLVQKLRVNWSQDADPPAVKDILQSYGEQSEPERRNRMERLSGLGEPRAVAALCRLMRFETSDVLSQRAALLVLGQLNDKQAESDQELPDALRGYMGLSKRKGADWLRLYADTLEGAEQALPRWERTIRLEQASLSEGLSDKSRRDAVRDLMRWHVDLLLRLGRRQQAEVAMRNTLDLLDGADVQLIDTVDWLMQREAWAVVDDVAERFAANFDGNALLLYRLAECRDRQGRTEQADAAAQRALEILPEEPDAHLVVGYKLGERGLLKWARREYERVLELGPLGSVSDLRTRLILSEMLHDQEDDLPAAQTLEKAVTAADSDENVRHILAQIRGDSPESVRSRMHYFYAQHALASGDREKHVQQLMAGIKSDPADADVLIAMYRVPDADDEWRKLTLDKIHAAVGKFRSDIRDAERSYREAPSDIMRDDPRQRLATQNNQLAWLLANTEGDLDEALRCSQRSLELSPENGGYLDTLGRCHYARGELEQAVRQQRRAVEQEPYSGQITRQLALFEKALAEAQAQGEEKR